MDSPPNNDTTGAPSSTDRFLANYDGPIFAAFFASQFVHWRYMQKQSVITGIPRPLTRNLKVGLGWGAVCLGLLVQTTLAKKAVHDHTDPVAQQSLKKRPWILEGAQRI
jgi:hypothetical protein